MTKVKLDMYTQLIVSHILFCGPIQNFSSLATSYNKHRGRTNSAGNRLRKSKVLIKTDEGIDINYDKSLIFKEFKKEK